MAKGKNNLNNLISIIVPVYKVEKYLDRCVESLVNQTYKNIEIILVDDGSPDNCPKMCDEWAKKDKRIKVIHKTNGGVSSARNAGLDNAKGNFIAFVDSDDWVDCNMYRKLMAKQNESNADLVFCRFSIVKNNIKYNVFEKLLEKLCSCDIKCLFYLDDIKINNNTMIHSHNVMGSLCRTLFKKESIGNARLNEKILIEEDLLFLATILNKKPKCALVDEYLYYYFENTSSAIQIISDKKIDYACNFSNEFNAQFSQIYPEICNVVKFTDYAMYYLMCLKSNKKITNKELLGWNTLKNYYSHKKYEFGFKTKIKYFLIRINARLIIKFLLTLKNNR